MHVLIKQKYLVMSYLHRIIRWLYTSSTGPGTCLEPWDFASARSHRISPGGPVTSPWLCLHAQTDPRRCIWDKPRAAMTLHLQDTKMSAVKTQFDNKTVTWELKWFRDAAGNVSTKGGRMWWRAAHLCFVFSRSLWTAYLEEQTLLPRSSRPQQRTWKACWRWDFQSHNMHQ